jgi:hypothetical protein
MTKMPGYGVTPENREKVIHFPSGEKEPEKTAFGAG